eukprot:TRINITY_DN3468_c0_g1_i1.p1 TRINITY_DN3468_c0_g1~~TRINITY_DN3468_c0_g1_i1.p1  ORF type:complete len:255 (-),score=35.99 TRINITY_DN3468_c0_g1_i1:57-821(-)
MAERNKRVFIFDIDGTIAPNGGIVSEDMKGFLQELRKKMHVAVVGGSPTYRLYDKLGQNVLEQFDFVFPENGLVAYKNGQMLEEKSIIKTVGNEKLNLIINWCLDYLSKLDLPLKRGTFIDFRTALINVSPAGRHLLPDDRKVWVDYDQKHNVRKTMVAKLKEFIKGWGLDIVIGGQMGFDIFPMGWDKSVCLQYLEHFEEIYFIGDKTLEGENDYPLFCHPRLSQRAYNTTGPEYTRKKVEELFFSHHIENGH